jgi:hypothetical protein
VNELDIVQKDLRKLLDILENGKSHVLKNKELGNINIDKGYTGKGGYGLLHIIEGRNKKDNYNSGEISALLYKVVDSVENGKIAIEQPKISMGRNVGRIGIEKDGIIGFVSLVRGAKDEKFVITGFAIDEKKREATEAIQTVIAQYGYTPEFSGIRKQVGAVISSLQQVSPQINEKSSDIRGNSENSSLKQQLEIARKTGFVQGVCECVAVIGDDYNLGKKLLTEMNVTKDMAKKFANPETYKNLEQGIFAQKQEHNLEQTQGIKR